MQFNLGRSLWFRKFYKQNGKLIIYYGKSDIELNKLIKDLKIDIVGSNCDITPFNIGKGKMIIESM